VFVADRGPSRKKKGVGFERDRDGYGELNFLDSCVGNRTSGRESLKDRIAYNITRERPQSIAQCICSRGSDPEVDCVLACWFALNTKVIEIRV